MTVETVKNARQVLEERTEVHFVLDVKLRHGVNQTNLTKIGLKHHLQHSTYNEAVLAADEIVDNEYVDRVVVRKVESSYVITVDGSCQILGIGGPVDEE